MKAHEIKVKNKDGKEFTVSIEHYEQNQGALTPVMEAKEAKAYCESYHKTKAALKKKMEGEDLKNKSE